ncbi:MAG: metallophosphoesterase [Planctomycetota bacterium]|nr:MAG: metallophosphoesterase [Planctomycetota bacterium]
MRRGRTRARARERGRRHTARVGNAQGNTGTWSFTSAWVVGQLVYERARAWLSRRGPNGTILAADRRWGNRLRTAIISDVHANVDALQTVLERIAAIGVDRVVCLGDIVGYNADPAACVDRVREACDTVIAGNHERMLLGRCRDGVARPVLAAIDWSREQLRAEQLAWLAELPEEAELEPGILLVHGSPRDPDEYIARPTVLRDNYRWLETHRPAVRLCCFGHTHRPLLAAPPRVQRRFGRCEEIELDPARLAFVNPGSVGQPRDGSPLASFAIHDAQRHTITFVRTPYPIVRAQQRVLAAGLHERFAQRLAQGR